MLCRKSRSVQLADNTDIDLSITMRIRSCTEQDLESLEWFGMFTPHRPIIRGTYQGHLAGSVEMLVASLGEFPVAQLWIDLPAPETHAIGRLWALRVFPFLQGRGIGTALIANAEERLREYGSRTAQIEVDEFNTRACQLYERLGYRKIHQVTHQETADNPAQAALTHAALPQVGAPAPLKRWILRKNLRIQATNQQLRT